MGLQEVVTWDTKSLDSVTTESQIKIPTLGIMSLNLLQVAEIFKGASYCYCRQQRYTCSLKKEYNYCFIENMEKNCKDLSPYHGTSYAYVCAWIYFYK